MAVDSQPLARSTFFVMTIEIENVLIGSKIE